MSQYISKLNKYFILLIISSIFSSFWHMIWGYALINEGMKWYITELPHYAQNFIKILTVAFLIYDFKKEHLKHAFLTCLIALFFPLGGIVFFSLLLIEKKQREDKKP